MRRLRKYLTDDLFQEAISLLDNGMSKTKVAKLLDLCINELSKKLSLINYEYGAKRKRYKYSYETLSSAKALRLSGMSIDKISKELNICYPTLCKILKHLAPNAVCIHKERARHSYTKYTCDYDFFNIIDTENKAYWLGFIYADGHLCKDSYKLEIRLSETDINHLRKFKIAINYSADVISGIKDTNFKKASKFALLYIHSKEMVNDLSKFIPRGKKSDKVKFPELQENLYQHFIRGYFDGDGYNIKTRDEIGFCGNFNFLNDLRNFFIESGVISLSGSFRSGSEYYTELRFGKKSSFAIRKFMYANATTFLERKCTII